MFFLRKTFKSTGRQLQLQIISLCLFKFQKPHHSLGSFLGPCFTLDKVKIRKAGTGIFNSEHNQRILLKQGRKKSSAEKTAGRELNVQWLMLKLVDVANLIKIHKKLPIGTLTSSNWLLRFPTSFNIMAIQIIAHSPEKDVRVSWQVANFTEIYLIIFYKVVSKIMQLTRLHFFNHDIVFLIHGPATTISISQLQLLISFPTKRQQLYVFTFLIFKEVEQFYRFKLLLPT